MNSKLKNIIALLLGTAVVGILIFIIFYWLFDLNWNESMEAAIPGAIAGLLAPFIGNYFKQKKEKKKLSE